MATPSKVPAFGDTVYFVNDNKERVKAQVTDATPQKDGSIKILVIPGDNSPYPVNAKYSAGKTPGTWTWKEPEVADKQEED